MQLLKSSTDDGAEVQLTLVDATAQSRDPDAVEYLRSSGLSLSSVVLALFDQSDDCIKVMDRDGRLTFMNCNGRQAMEVDDFGSISGCNWPELWPAEAQAAVSEAIALAADGKSSRFEAFCPTAKGTPRWWDVSVSPIVSASGEVEALLSSSRDITQRKINEQSMATMLDEMKHRLRNAYAIGGSIAVVSALDQPENAVFAASVASRLLSISEAQTAMIDISDATVSDIVTRIIHAFGGGSAATIHAMPATRLTESEARALGLVMGELCTNSVKHGSMGGKGTVTVSARQDGSMLHIDWTEHHTTPSEGRIAVSSGQGEGIMHTMLQVIGGTLESERLESGYRARLTIHAPGDRRPSRRSGTPPPPR